MTLPLLAPLVRTNVTKLSNDAVLRLCRRVAADAQTVEVFMASPAAHRPPPVEHLEHNLALLYAVAAKRRRFTPDQKRQALSTLEPYIRDYAPSHPVLLHYDRSRAQIHADQYEAALAQSVARLADNAELRRRFAAGLLD